jgi:hypothetical protein
MEGQLINSEGPYFNQHTQAYEYVASVLANLRMVSPRNFFKLAAVA